MQRNRVYPALFVLGLVLLVASFQMLNKGSVEESDVVVSPRSVSHNELTYVLRCNKTEFTVNESIEVDYILFNNNSARAWLMFRHCR